MFGGCQGGVLVFWNLVGSWSFERTSGCPFGKWLNGQMAKLPNKGRRAGNKREKEEGGEGRRLGVGCFAAAELEWDGAQVLAKGGSVVVRAWEFLRCGAGGVAGVCAGGDWGRG